MMKPQGATAANKNNILAFDGGGTIGGYVEALQLGAVFGDDASGRDILKNHGQGGVYATSAGCLVAAALAADYTPGEIRGMLECEQFLDGIYADKKVAPNPEAAKSGQFVKYPNAPAKVGDKFGEVQRDFIVAAMEVSTGGLYSTDKKTNFLQQVLNHDVDPSHPAAKAVPALCDNTREKIGDKTFNQVGKDLGVGFTFLCQDRDDKKINALTTRQGVPPEGEILNGQKVRHIGGDMASFAEATSASPNPRPLFDKPVQIKDKTNPMGRNCDDGGMTGHNSPVAFGIASAIQGGANPKDLSVMSFGLGTLEKNYASATALKSALSGNAMLYGSKAFDDFFAKEQTARLADTCSLLPNPESQIIRMAPASTDYKDPFNYASSMLKTQDGIEQMKEWSERYVSGQVPNQQIDNNGTMIGHATFEQATSAARDKLGLSASSDKNDYTASFVDMKTPHGFNHARSTKLADLRLENAFFVAGPKEKSAAKAPEKTTDGASRKTGVADKIRQQHQP